MEFTLRFFGWTANILIAGLPAGKRLAAATRAHYNARYTSMSVLMPATDLASAVVAALQPAADNPPAARNLPLAKCLRAKIIGLLLRKTRLAAECTSTACAEFLQVPPARYVAWEHGEAVPSLPELELLAGFLQGAPTPRQQSDYRLLRQRIIGAQLQMARQASGEAAARSIVPPETLRAYELGERSIPMTNLSALAQAFGIKLSAFLKTTPTNSSAAQATDGNAATLPGFAANRQNAAYIRLAMAFRHIQAEDLNHIADALFAIIKERAQGDIAEPNAAS